ncbi:hypothetical protein DPSP01_008018 [Paraphaeosphaeria sporulosa]
MSNYTVGRNHCLRVAFYTPFEVLEIIKRRVGSMDEPVSLGITLLFCLSACAIYFICSMTMGSWSKSKTTKSPSDIDFIASIIENRERIAREEADQLNKLKLVETKANGEYEDLPDSGNDRRARHKGSGRKYSYWANQARMRRKQAAGKRRFEALEKHREMMLKSGAKAGKEEENLDCR